jgi:CRP-like cAMP-binding protein
MHGERQSFGWGIMERYLPLLQTTSLFAGLDDEALLTLLRELGAARRCYGKGETLLLAGQPNRRIGIVLSGQIQAVRPAPGGALVPITHMAAGGVFGDVLGGSSMSSPVTVIAREGCEVLLIPYDRLLALRDGSSPAQIRVVQNLVRTISDKYFMLSHRVDLLVLKTLRAKVCAYLLSEAERAGSQTFTIPYSRIQLADYLNCDRSALSRELSQMQRERLLDTYRSSFKLLQPEALRREIQ